MSQAVAAQEPDLFVRIAEALPPEQREAYWREMAHLRHLGPDDELLRLVRAMGYLTLLAEGVPLRVAEERAELDVLLRDSVAVIEATHRATLAHHRHLEARLAQLPAEVAKGIAPEAIAARIAECLRQQFAATGLPETAQALVVQAKALRQASKELAGSLDSFAHPQNGAAVQVKEALAWMRADLRNATDHVRAQMGGLGRELYRTIAVLCAGALALGFVLGILYHRWGTEPVVPQQPTAQAAPQPGPKRRAALN